MHSLGQNSRIKCSNFGRYANSLAARCRMIRNFEVASVPQINSIHFDSRPTPTCDRHMDGPKVPNRIRQWWRKRMQYRISRANTCEERVLYYTIPYEKKRILNWRYSWKNAILLTWNILSARHIASWKSKINNSSHNGIRTLEKCWTKCISVAGDCAKKWQNMTYIIILWLTVSVYEPFGRPSYINAVIAHHTAAHERFHGPSFFT